MSDADIEKVITLTKLRGTTCIPNFTVLAWGRKPSCPRPPHRAAHADRGRRPGPGAG
ncbi:hypothetical protein [Streptomyces sp. WM6386]|uniref:hypothetical protein n=1 Tax=Streptomyces sp. WM6386 TaxID=1415558 RepID=UPI00131D4D5D|nr:hypothetical protein [Streptomyces sp. WM6386]